MQSLLESSFGLTLRGTLEYELYHMLTSAFRQGSWPFIAYVNYSLTVDCLQHVEV